MFILKVVVFMYVSRKITNSIKENLYSILFSLFSFRYSLFSFRYLLVTIAYNDSSAFSHTLYRARFVLKQWKTFE